MREPRGQRSDAAIMDSRTERATAMEWPSFLTAKKRRGRKKSVLIRVIRGQIFQPLGKHILPFREK